MYIEFKPNYYNSTEVFINDFEASEYLSKVSYLAKEAFSFDCGLTMSYPKYLNFSASIHFTGIYKLINIINLKFDNDKIEPDIKSQIHLCLKCYNDIEELLSKDDKELIKTNSVLSKPFQELVVSKMGKLNYSHKS